MASSACPSPSAPDTVVSPLASFFLLYAFSSPLFLGSFFKSSKYKKEEEHQWQPAHCWVRGSWVCPGYNNLRGLNHVNAWTWNLFRCVCVRARGVGKELGLRTESSAWTSYGSENTTTKCILPPSDMTKKLQAAILYNEVEKSGKSISIDIHQ